MNPKNSQHFCRIEQAAQDSESVSAVYYRFLILFLIYSGNQYHLIKKNYVLDNTAFAIVHTSLWLSGAYNQVVFQNVQLHKVLNLPFNSCIYVNSFSSLTCPIQCYGDPETSTEGPNTRQETSTQSTQTLTSTATDRLAPGMILTVILIDGGGKGVVERVESPERKLQRTCKLHAGAETQTLLSRAVRWPQ